METDTAGNPIDRSLRSQCPVHCGRTGGCDECRRALPCPHGRFPMGKKDGFKRCPHCLGVGIKGKV